MSLSLTDRLAESVAALDQELRVGGEAIGVGVAGQIASLAPALAPAEAGEPDGVLIALDLDHEGEPDGLSLAACLAAHRAYVTGRGRPHAVSAGALALARLLVWAHRAALLGTPPTLRWIGPAPRLPAAADGQLVLRARSAVTVDGRTRRAEAAALIDPPAGRA
ncbi:MAG TPA: hypothetical protein PKE32_09215 [Miltoncostaeaceae bacterium]|nr:hypothetical protein [Miltoncostaeaceae bacterium]